MATYLRFHGPSAQPARRWAIGVQLSSGCRRLTGALVTATGRGMETRVELAAASNTAVPDETAARLAQLAGGAAGPAHLAAARAELATVQASIVRDLLAEAGPARTDVLAVGVHDPGIWASECGPAEEMGTDASRHAGFAGSMPPRSEPVPVSSSVRGYLGLCDPARVAELTGLNVIDAFPSRDLASGGLGGPVAALAEWVLLAARDRNRVLLDLGRTVRMSFLPMASAAGTPSRIRSFDVGPGMAMLDQLTARLTHGKQSIDSGGRLAVQGRRVADLLEHWLADPYFRTPLPRWNPRGVASEPFLRDAFRLAVESSWSVRDLLCTATHFLADSVALALRQQLPLGTVVHEIILAGGGQQNGMLLREIDARLPKVSLIRTTQFGSTGEVLGPACTAALALLHLDQMPANHPAITGTEMPRVLGRLTPGSPQNWQRLVAELTGSRPAVQPLRSAL